MFFNGVDIFKLSKDELRAIRPQIQIIFQDPYSSLSPRMPIGEVIAEGVREHNLVPHDEVDAYVARIMRACGLHEYYRDRYPHEFSGGQRQRLSIARAIAKNPEIYIFDDSFSALDYKTDSALRAALKEYTKDATSIIVAQRIGTIMDADQIIVLEEGRIAGKGTHRELMQNCPLYREIAFSQLSAEELENG